MKYIRNRLIVSNDLYDSPFRSKWYERVMVFRTTEFFDSPIKLGLSIRVSNEWFRWKESIGNHNITQGGEILFENEEDKIFYDLTWL